MYAAHPHFKQLLSGMTVPAPGSPGNGNTSSTTLTTSRTPSTMLLSDSFSAAALTALSLQIHDDDALPSAEVLQDMLNKQQQLTPSSSATAAAAAGGDDSKTASSKLGKLFTAGQPQGIAPVGAANGAVSRSTSLSSNGSSSAVTASPAAVTPGNSSEMLGTPSKGPRHSNSSSCSSVDLGVSAPWRLSSLGSVPEGDHNGTAVKECHPALVVTSAFAAEASTPTAAAASQDPSVFSSSSSAAAGAAGVAGGLAGTAGGLGGGAGLMSSRAPRVGHHLLQRSTSAPANQLLAKTAAAAGAGGFGGGMLGGPGLRGPGRLGRTGSLNNRKDAPNR